MAKKNKTLYKITKEVDTNYKAEKKYFEVSGTVQTILFDGSEESIEFLESYLKSYPNLKKKIFLKLVPYWRYNPFKKVVELPYDSEMNFPGELVIKANRINSFDLKNNKVYTFNVEEPATELEFRDTVEKIGVNAPSIVGTGKNHIVQKLVYSERITSIEEHKKVIEDALEQLRQMYSYFGIDIVEGSEGKLIKTQIHGDFHSGNIGSKSNNSAVIFDWDDRRYDYAYIDILNLAYSQYDAEGKINFALVENFIDSLNDSLDCEIDVELNIEKSLDSLSIKKQEYKAFRDFKKIIQENDW